MYLLETSRSGSCERLKIEVCKLPLKVRLRVHFPLPSAPGGGFRLLEAQAEPPWPREG